MGYVAFTTVVFVGNVAKPKENKSKGIYGTCTATQIFAICKMNGRKNKAIGRGDSSIYAATQY